jgi:putative Mn2+ efflux pump MntP
VGTHVLFSSVFISAVVVKSSSVVAEMANYAGAFPSIFSLEAFLLSLASSTDNFMVGLSVGISQRDLGIDANTLISVCNASGAGVAGYLGGSLQQRLPVFLAPLLAGIAFGVLSGQEYVVFYNGLIKGAASTGTDNSDERHLDFPRAMKLAVPMTLNNLAGGVAGGAVGVSPLQATCYGFLASFLTMTVGYLVGLHLAKKAVKKGKGAGKKTEQSVLRYLLDPSFVSASLLGALCFMSLHEAWAAATRVFYFCAMP